MNTANESVAIPANWQERGELLENLEISLRYYRRREWFFDKCDKLCNGLTIVGGAAVVSEYLSGGMALLGVGIAVFGMLPLVFNFSEQRFTYRSLASQACEQIGGIEAHSALAQVTDQWLDEAKLAYAKLSAQEPPTLAILELMCEQDYFVSRGIFDKVKHIPWWVRAFAQFGNLRPAHKFIIEKP